MSDTQLQNWTFINSNVLRFGWFLIAAKILWDFRFLFRLHDAFKFSNLKLFKFTSALNELLKVSGKFLTSPIRSTTKDAGRLFKCTLMSRGKASIDVNSWTEHKMGRNNVTVYLVTYAHLKKSPTKLTNTFKLVDAVNTGKVTISIFCSPFIFSSLRSVIFKLFKFNVITFFLRTRKSW